MGTGLPVRSITAGPVQIGPAVAVPPGETVGVVDEPVGPASASIANWSIVVPGGACKGCR